MGFTLRSEDIDLPLGASAASTRMLVMWNDRPVFGLTQGAFRTYLFPVHSPAGFALTSESPSDHPHHHSIWVGADHVNLHVPAEHRTEVLDLLERHDPASVGHQRRVADLAGTLARAEPVPFCACGLRPPPRTSARVFCALVPARPAAM